MNIVFEQSALEFQAITSSVLAENKVRLSIARLDKLHADVSGNKLFKLHYFLEEALSSLHKRVMTFGGAYSNHLVATAFACKALNLQSIGIVRREEHEDASHTINKCTDLGMKIFFVSRSDYKRIKDDSYLTELKSTHGECTIIPEGGYHPLGARGASLIMDRLTSQKPTHVCVAVGTATTLAGLVLNTYNAKIVGVPVIKNMTDVHDRIFELTGLHQPALLSIIDGFHFGGYARSSTDLIDFMNHFFHTYEIPLDFVYTAKMMYGIMEKIKDGYFPQNSHIICLHTGGLQGNKSLKPYNLTY